MPGAGAAPTPPEAPGEATLDPQPDGVHYTMPSLPVGASGLTLLKQITDEVALEDWLIVATGLSGGATGIDATGFDEDGPDGWGNTACYYKVLAEPNSGSPLFLPALTSASTATTTTAVPGTASAPTLDPQPDGVHWTIPSAPARTLTLKLQKKSDGFPTWRDLVDPVTATETGTDALGEYDGEWLGPAGYNDFVFYYRVVAANIYGVTNGTQDDVTTVPLPDDAAEAPTVTGEGQSNEEEPFEYWYEVTMPDGPLPDNAASLTLYASAQEPDPGTPFEPTEPRGQFAPEAVVNTSGATFGGGNPSGSRVSVGARGWNIYGESSTTVFDDSYVI